MKFIFTLLLIFILIPVIVVGGAVAFIYFSFFNPQPAEYAYMNPADQITSIEIAEISFADGNPTPTGIGFITDKEAFIADLNELECNKGINVSSLQHLSSDQKIEGIVIHYQDGSFEIITAYLSVGMEEGAANLSGGLYSFDVDEFEDMLDEYKDLYTENLDDLNKIPDLDGVEIPDVEIPEDLEDVEIPEGQN